MARERDSRRLLTARAVFVQMREASDQGKCCRSFRVNGSTMPEVKGLTSMEESLAVDYAKRYAATSAVALYVGQDDSIGFAAELRGKTDPGNPMDLRVTLLRSEPRRWAPAAPKESAPPVPVPPQVRQ